MAEAQADAEEEEPVAEAAGSAGEETQAEADEPVVLADVSAVIVEVPVDTSSEQPETAVFESDSQTETGEATDTLMADSDSQPITMETPPAQQESAD